MIHPAHTHPHEHGPDCKHSHGAHGHTHAAHKGIPARVNPKDEAKLRKVMAGLFRRQGQDAAGAVAEFVKAKDPAKAALLADHWDRTIADAVKPVLFGVFKAGATRRWPPFGGFRGRHGRR